MKTTVNTQLLDDILSNYGSIRKLELENIKLFQQLFNECLITENDKKYYRNEDGYLIEISYSDTVAFMKDYRFIDFWVNEKTGVKQYVFDIIFVSERVKELDTKVKNNQFRFTYSTYDNKLTMSIRSYHGK